MDSPIIRAEYKEYSKRMEEEHIRMNERISILEEEFKKITDIVISINDLASSMKRMADEQEIQGAKLEKLEARDGEKWRQVTGYIATAVIGIILGFIFNQIGM